MGHGERARGARGEARFWARAAAVRALLYLCLVGPAFVGFGLRALASSGADVEASGRSTPGSPPRVGSPVAAWGALPPAPSRWDPPALGAGLTAARAAGHRPVSPCVGALFVVLGLLISGASLAVLRVRWIPLPAVGFVAAGAAGILIGLGYPALWTVVLVSLAAWQFGNRVRRESLRAEASEALAGAGGPSPDALAAAAQAARNAQTEQELAALGALAADAWETQVMSAWQRLGFRLSRQQDEATGRRYLVAVDPDNRVTCFYLRPAGRPLSVAEVAWCARLARRRRALAGVVVTRELVTSRVLHRMARRGSVQIQDPLDFVMFRHFLNAQSPETLVRFGGAYSFIIIEPHGRCH
jgi:hypothetical protein